MIRLALVAAPAALTLGACMPQEDVMPVTPGICDASKAQQFVGREAAAVSHEAQVAANARTVRVYREGSPVTMDYREDRLNLVTTANGTILEVKCG